jgi:hypothetical protein
MWAPFFYNPENSNNDTFLEEDFGELGDTNIVTSPSSLNTAGGWWNCGGNTGSCFGLGGISPAIQDTPLSYNTHGMLVTGDGGSATGLCGYFASGVTSGLQHSNFVSCLRGNWVSPGQGGIWVRTHLILPLGPEHGSGISLQKTQSAYIQRITVWVCPGGAQPTGGATYGNQCNLSPVLVSSPPL